MQAPEDDRMGALGGQDDTAAHGDLEFTGVGGGMGMGGEGAVAREGPQEQGRRQGPASSYLASAILRDSESDFKEFRLSFPFRCYLYAEMACAFLSPIAQSLDPEVHSEFTVRGNVLHIRLSAEDPHILELSATSVVQKISSILPFVDV